MAHYPFAHRRKAIVYPWVSQPLPTFTDFEFIEWYEGFFNNGARLGESLPNENLTDLLSSDVTLPERRVVTYGIQALYRVKDSSVPPGAILGVNEGGFTFTYWTAQPGPVLPNTRAQRRNKNHKYYLSAQLGFSLRMFNDPFFPTIDHALGASGRWSSTLSPTVADFAETDPIPTVHRRGHKRYAEHSFSGGPSDLAGYSSSVSGFGSNFIRDHLLSMKTTLDSELAAIDVGMTFRIAAVPYGVPAAIPNSTGANSLENWMPWASGIELDF